MLMKLPPGFDFINVLPTAFALVDPESVITQSSLQYHFTLLGSTSVKSVHRKLMKSTPDHAVRTLIIQWKGKKVNDKFHLSNLRGLLFKIVLLAQNCYLVHDPGPILQNPLPLLNGRQNVL